MNPKPKEHLELGQLGQRFIDPIAEAEYQVWRKDAAFPVMLLGGWAAVSSWLFVIPAMWWMAPAIFETVGWLMYGVLLPVYTLFCIIPLHHRMRPHMLIIVMVMNLTAGLFVVSLSYWVGNSLGVACAAAIVICLYAPFMRVPPLHAFICTAPYLGLVSWLAINEFAQGGLTDMERFGYTCVPVMSLMTVLIVCSALENLFRRSYVREQLIETQQTALENSQRMIRRYIPPAVADHIVMGKSDLVDAPKRQRVTILFSDIVGFTDIADRLDAESLTQIINEYMAAMSEIVDAHQGTVNEFIGDGVMAIFGAPQELDSENQARQAISAAQAMQTKMPEMHQSWRKLGLDEELKIRIGINTGVLSVGSFGSEGRMTYTAIGLQTNIAARIQSHCEPGGILISNATYQLVDDVIDCEAKGEVECKGVHFPVKVYAPA